MVKQRINAYYTVLSGKVIKDKFEGCCNFQYSCSFVNDLFNNIECVYSSKCGHT